MPLALRHRDDPSPNLDPLPGLVVRQEGEPGVMARLQDRPVDEFQGRMAEGHTAWVARLNGVDAAWGWVATRRARIGELDLTFDVPAGERYLWNFVTRVDHRGRGLYPRLLDSIVRMESAVADRFWIVRAPENRSSGAGIQRAGFRPVATLSFDSRGTASVAGPEAAAASRLLAVARSAGHLAPCWRCARAGRLWIMFCRPGACSCDYQRPEVPCS